MNNMELVIHEYFKEHAGLSDLKNAALMVVRRDGVPLYSYKGYETQWNDSSVSALVSGMWQAAETLTGFIPGKNEEVFRFSYDTSSKGIYIIELVGKFEPLYLSFIYFDLDNPAKIKSQIRSLEAGLSQFIDDNIAFDSNMSAQDFLFSSISDDEMDDLFANVVAE